MNSNPLLKQLLSEKTEEDEEPKPYEMLLSQLINEPLSAGNPVNSKAQADSDSAPQPGRRQSASTSSSSLPDGESSFLNSLLVGDPQPHPDNNNPGHHGEQHGVKRKSDCLTGGGGSEAQPTAGKVPPSKVLQKNQILTKLLSQPYKQLPSVATTIAAPRPTDLPHSKLPKDLRQKLQQTTPAGGQQQQPTTTTHPGAVTSSTLRADAAAAGGAPSRQPGVPHPSPTGYGGVAQQQQQQQPCSALMEKLLENNGGSAAGRRDGGAAATVATPDQSNKPMEMDWVVSEVPDSSGDVLLQQIVAEVLQLQQEMNVDQAPQSTSSSRQDLLQELKKLLKTEEHNPGNEMGHVKSEADTSGLPGLDSEPYSNVGTSQHQTPPQYAMPPAYSSANHFGPPQQGQQQRFPTAQGMPSFPQGPQTSQPYQPGKRTLPTNSIVCLDSTDPGQDCADSRSRKDKSGIFTDVVPGV
ncbi:PREDICTED: RNA polymerase II degradation factor 1-like [Priapulus caudatus]|uniref:RNA polymerase II degradation factor 1-like n=1 Tax=Priapulus caudatus TaxID=37621 RepID=A0ABM1DQG5_PRICU|nr:PREDICTED: RNA polymerase II degradation factor 1-like [Priapulus caudatus]